MKQIWSHNIIIDCSLHEAIAIHEQIVDVCVPRFLPACLAAHNGSMAVSMALTMA